jgi:hypothetical protein
MSAIPVFPVEVFSRDTKLDAASLDALGNLLGAEEERLHPVNPTQAAYVLAPLAAALYRQLTSREELQRALV